MAYPQEQTEQPSPQQLKAAADTALDKTPHGAYYNPLMDTMIYTGEFGTQNGIIGRHPILGTTAKGRFRGLVENGGGVGVMAEDMVRSLSVWDERAKKEIQLADIKNPGADGSLVTLQDANMLQGYGQEMCSFFGMHLIMLLRGLLQDGFGIDFVLPTELRDAKIIHKMDGGWYQENLNQLSNLQIAGIKFPKITISENYRYCEGGQIQALAVTTNNAEFLNLLCSVILPKYNMDEFIVLASCATAIHKKTLGDEGQEIYNSFAQALKSNNASTRLFNLRFALLDLCTNFTARNLIGLHDKLEQLLREPTCPAQYKQYSNDCAPDEAYYRDMFNEGSKSPVAIIVSKILHDLRSQFFGTLTSKQAKQNIIDVLAFLNEQLPNINKLTDSATQAASLQALQQNIAIGLKYGMHGFCMLEILSELHNTAKSVFAKYPRELFETLSALTQCETLYREQNLSPKTHAKLLTIAASLTGILANLQQYNITAMKTEILHLHALIHQLKPKFHLPKSSNSAATALSLLLARIADMLVHIAAHDKATQQAEPQIQADPRVDTTDTKGTTHPWRHVATSCSQQPAAFFAVTRQQSVERVKTPPEQAPSVIEENTVSPPPSSPRLYGTNNPE